METLVLSDILYRQLITVFIAEYRLVLSTVILIQPFHSLHKRSQPQIADKQRDLNNTLCQRAEGRYVRIAEQCLYACKDKRRQYHKQRDGKPHAEYARYYCDSRCQSGIIAVFLFVLFIFRFFFAYVICRFVLLFFFFLLVFFVLFFIEHSAHFARLVKVLVAVCQL